MKGVLPGKLKGEKSQGAQLSVAPVSVLWKGVQKQVYESYFIAGTDNEVGKKD